MDKKKIVQQIIQLGFPIRESATAYAPANVALIKYWGKADINLNIPITDSLSLSLGHLGTTMCVSASNDQKDRLILNNVEINKSSIIFKRLQEFLDLVRPKDSFYFKVISFNTVPTACGLASSASAYAALTKALDSFFGWGLDKQRMSLLARLGSGSACRSFSPGFVYWFKGKRKDGLDSYAHQVDTSWDDIRIGIIKVQESAKKISSRAAMILTQKTAKNYIEWPGLVGKHIEAIKKAIQKKDFVSLGAIAEENSLAMHDLMRQAKPSIIYSNTLTLQAQQKVRDARANGMAVYFTQDAGPQLKILFTKEDSLKVLKMFPEIDCINPFL